MPIKENETRMETDDWWEGKNKILTKVKDLTRDRYGNEYK